MSEDTWSNWMMGRRRLHQGLHACGGWRGIVSWIHVKVGGARTPRTTATALSAADNSIIMAGLFVADHHKSEPSTAIAAISSDIILQYGSHHPQLCHQAPDSVSV
eukprot:scaffold12431_cov57-Attheya_sp.AAC.12